MSEEKKQPTPIRVTNVSCSLRRSVNIGDSWVTIEMGAEATVNPKVDPQLAQDAIYRKVADDINIRIKNLSAHFKGKK